MPSKDTTDNIRSDDGGPLVRLVGDDGNEEPPASPIMSLEDLLRPLSLAGDAVAAEAVFRERMVSLPVLKREQCPPSAEALTLVLRACCRTVPVDDCRAWWGGASSTLA